MLALLASDVFDERSQHLKTSSRVKPCSRGARTTCAHLYPALAVRRTGAGAASRAVVPARPRPAAAKQGAPPRHAPRGSGAMAGTGRPMSRGMGARGCSERPLDPLQWPRGFLQCAEHREGLFERSSLWGLKGARIVQLADRGSGVSFR